MALQKAVRSKAFLKLAIAGPTGSGKTKGALRLARGLTDKPIAVLDTENRSSSLYAGETVVDARTGDPYQIDFLVDDLAAPYTAQAFVRSFQDALKAGVGCIVIDSFSHVWEAVLAYKEQLDARAGSNSYTNWNAAGKQFTDVLNLVRQSQIHVIVCMRSKMDYVLEQNDKGKQVPRKVGLAPIVRDGTEYEFSALFEVDNQHMTRDSKGRFVEALGVEAFMIDEMTGKKLADWLSSGVDYVAPPAPEVWTEDQKLQARLLSSMIKAGKSDEDSAAIIKQAQAMKPSEAIPFLQQHAAQTAEGSNS